MRLLIASFVALLVAGLSAVPAYSGSSHPALDGLANAQVGPIKLKFPDAPLSQVLDSIAQTGGFKVAFDAGGHPDWWKKRVSADWEEATIRSALERLAREAGLDFESPSPHKLVVRYKGK